MVARKDSFKVTEFNKTANGFLNISGIVTRTGVFSYQWGNELRPEAEVFRLDSLESMFAIPVTWQHPVEDDVTVQVLLREQKGFVAGKPEKIGLENGLFGVRLDNIIIQDPVLISEIEKNNISEFSLGYSCDLEETSGRFDNEDYVRVQKNIVYNHLALVDNARCGEVCSIIETEGDPMTTVSKKDCADKMDKKDEEPEKEKMEEKKDDDSMKSLHEKLDRLIGMLEGKSDKKDEDMDKEKEEEKEEKSSKKDSLPSKKPTSFLKMTSPESRSDAASGEFVPTKYETYTRK